MGDGMFGELPEPPNRLIETRIKREAARTRD